MRAYTQFIIGVIAGAVLGIVLAYGAIEARIGFYQTRSGPWIGSDRAGGIAGDPYTKARLARDGELPLGGGEGMTLTARTDDRGRTLSGACAYRLRGEPFAARWWTISVYDSIGALLALPNGRNGFTSKEILRDDKGTIDIILSPRVQAGNWLPTTTDADLQLVMRLYDTPHSGNTSNIHLALPSIERVACP